MEQEVMKALLEWFEQSDWQEMTVTIGGDRLHVSRQAQNGGPPPMAPAAPAPPELSAPSARPGPPEPGEPPAPPESSAPGPPATSVRSAPPGAGTDGEGVPAGTTITAPSVGLFWRAPAPGAPPFVEVGGHVAAGDTVAIVEVMKLMNHVTSPVSGSVVAVLPENGEAVEFGQVLAVVAPEG